MRTNAMPTRQFRSRERNVHCVVVSFPLNESAWERSVPSHKITTWINQTISEISTSLFMIIIYCKLVTLVSGELMSLGELCFPP